MLRFPQYYYGGRFARVQDRDNDLPRRVDGDDVSEERRTRTEWNGVLNGERIIARFHDGNTINDIVGGLLVAASYPTGWDEDEQWRYPTIQGLLSIVADRLRDKAERSRGGNATHLEDALSDVRVAAGACRAGNYASSELAIHRAVEAVDAANRWPRKGNAIQRTSGDQRTDDE